MKIDIIKVGKLECNCYLLEINNRVLVIDPGDEVDKIISKINGREVVGVIITHYHCDHIGALDELVGKYNVLVYDRYNLCEGENIISEFMFDVIYTPGHKEDAVTLYFKKDKVMLTGDFIFRDSIGRCDLPGGNIEEMVESIRKIVKYDRDIILYPGHGDETNLGYEMVHNYYINLYMR